MNPNLTATLTRTVFGNDGTQGALTFDDGGPSWPSLELPWRNNQRKISSIPPGSYTATKFFSPKHGAFVYLLQNVPDRDDVEIHSANWAGDVSLGYFSNLLGCIALGKSFDRIPPYLNQIAVVASRVAIAELFAFTGGADFRLTVSGLPDGAEYPAQTA